MITKKHKAVRRSLLSALTALLAWTLMITTVYAKSVTVVTDLGDTASYFEKVYTVYTNTETEATGSATFNGTSMTLTSKSSHTAEGCLNPNGKTHTYVSNETTVYFTAKQTVVVNYTTSHAASGADYKKGSGESGSTTSDRKFSASIESGATVPAGGIFWFKLTSRDGKWDLNNSSTPPTYLESTTINFTITPAADTSVEGNASFFVPNDAANVYYYNYLDQATAAAQSTDSKLVVVATDGYARASDGSKVLTIPSGVNLVIPYEAYDEGFFGEKPDNYLTQQFSHSAIKSGGITKRNYAYRTLRVESGTRIECYGSINVNGQRQNNGQSYVGVTLGGYGKLVLGTENTGAPETNESNMQQQLVIKNGGKLYAYGYVTGTGLVEVENGGTVHELLQVASWPGGSNGSKWVGISTSKEDLLFVLTEYYIQNIEAPVRVRYGATMNVEAVFTVQGSVVYQSSPYITTANAAKPGLFLLDNSDNRNPYILRVYDVSADRMNYFMKGGNAAIGHIEVTPISGYTINSSSYILPINHSMTLNVESGASVTVDKKLAILPGAQLNIKEGATLDLSNELYIFDVGDYTYSDFFNRADNMSVDSTNKYPNHCPVPYVATLNNVSPQATGIFAGVIDPNGSPTNSYYVHVKNITASGKLQVDGTLNLIATEDSTGALLTTNGKSNADKVIAGAGVINNGTPVDKDIRVGFAAEDKLKTVAATYGLANIAGVGNLKPLASGTYYGQESGEWYSYVVKANTAENLTAFTNITEAAAAEGNTVTRYNSETKTQETVSNVLGVVSTYLDSAQKTQSVFSFDMEAGSGPVITGGGENLVVTPLLNAEEGTVSYALSGVSADVTLGVTTEGTPTTIKTVAPNADNAEISSVELLLPANADVSAYFSDIGCTIQATSADIGKTLYIPLEAAAAIGPEKGTYALAYTTVADAVAAADGTNSYVTVLKDRTMTDPIVVAAAQNITLDLNGKTLTGKVATVFAGATGQKLVTNNGTLSLVSSNARGTITFNGGHTSGSLGNATAMAATLYNKGVIKCIDNVTLKETYGDIYSAALFNDDGATIEEIHSGTFTGNDYSAGTAILARGTIKTIGTSGGTVEITGRRGIALYGKGSIETIGGAGSTVTLTSSQRGINTHASTASVGTIGEKGSTVSITMKKSGMGRTAILGESSGVFEVIGGEGSTLNITVEEGTIYTQTAINVSKAPANGEVIIGDVDSTININVTNNVASTNTAAEVYGIRNSTKVKIGASGSTININVNQKGNGTAYGIYTSGTASSLGAEDANIQVISNYTGIKNTGTIEAMDGVTVISTDTTGSYYALENTMTLKVNGGNFHHANGAANAVKNTSSLTYKTDYGLSEDTKDITLLDGTTTYPCYYVKHVNHTEKIVTGTPASCTEDGLSDGKVCSICGEVLAEQEPIPAGHTYGELITKQDEIHTQTELKASVAAHYQCSVCEKYFTEEKAETTLEKLTGEMPEHTYDGWINTDPENHWQECSVCKLKSGEAAHSDSGDEDTNCDTCGRELHTHDYSNRGDVVTPGNCQTETTYQAQCSCGEISGIIPGEKDTSRHTGKLIWTQTAEKHAQTYSCCDTATVAEENHEWSDGNCSECAYVCTHKDDNLDHICDYGCGVYQGVHADAANDGDHVCDYGCKEVLEDCSDVNTDRDHACDICGKQDVTQHSYTSKVTDPTCVDKGYTTYTCNCGDIYTEEIKETGHTEGAAVVENEEAATCKAAGSYDNVIYCTVCKAELSRETIVVEKLAHTAGSAVEENRKESTCTVAGSYDSVVKCSVCGEEMSRNTVALKLAAHTEGTVVVENEKAATCTAEGSYDNVVYCTVCNAELSRQTVTTDEMGHTEVVDAAKTPTCTETGLTEGKHCSVCGEVLVEQKIVAATGHAFTDYVSDNNASFDEDGTKTAVCDNGCGTKNTVTDEGTKLTAVAQIGETKYETLAEAIAAAENGSTVTLLTDASGAGVVVNKDLTIDFDGYIYTLTEGVGSKNTESNGLQLLKGNNITLKNGALTVADSAKDKFYILVQNYANLTVEGMDLDGTNLDKWSTTDGDSYVLSNNSGTVNVIGNTSITANDEGDKAYAFDVCKNGSYDAPIVNVNTTGTISGKIEVSESISNNLNISGGTFTVEIEEKWCAEGFIPTANTDGTYGVKVGAYVAETDGKKYETLAEAVAAAENGSTVNLLTDASGAGVVVNKDITIDFDGHTYTLNRAVGSAGTETLGFQILKENNVTLKNGILTSTNAVSGKEVKVLIQNYSDLTLTDMDLIGTNTNIQYALSNNSGNIVLNGNTDITVHENAVAFDVYDYSVAGYAVPSMKVNTTGKITGNIEVSETATLAISGGTFTTKIEEKWCAEGFIPTVNTDGTYGVKAGVYVAQNGETKYETLADAIAAEGEKVIVLQDITIHGPIPATDKIIDFNGHTISGTLLGTLKLNNGTLITAEGKKMAGPDADYYQTTDAMFTMDAALNINVLSGTMTLVPDEWWTLPGQKLEISEGASFVIPAGKTLQVRSEVIVNGEVTIDGTVNLYDANATVTTAIENLNIITTAGDKVWYTEGKYVVHTHTPGAEVTCTEDQICTVCGDVLKEATGHTLTQIEAKAPTCTEIGWEAYEKCSVCDYTTYQEIAAKGHSYESEVTAPTCTAEGYTTYTCSVCNDSYVADKVNALGHTDAEAVKENEKAPTCTDDGSYESVVYCSVCDAELSRNTVTVSASGHTAGEAVTENEKAATCTDDGSYDTVVYCTVCDAVLSRVTTVVPTSGHSYDNGVETKAPTCTEEGVKTFTCGTCGHSYTAAISKASHSYSSNVKEPTCTEEGNETMTCSACGDSYVIKTKPAKGHAWVEADCDTPKTCSVCGETEGDEKGHSYDGGVVTKDPTTSETGVKTFTCETCGHSYTEEIPMLEAPTGTTVSGTVKAYNSNNAPEVKLYVGGVEKHSATVAYVKASGSQHEWAFTFSDVEAGTYDLVVTKAGHLTYTVTGVVVTDEAVDLTDHSNTAVSSMSMLCGDIDGDGNINTSDINVIYKPDNYYKSVSVAAIPMADLNGDNNINTLDINIIYKPEHYYKGVTGCTVPY